MYTYQNPRPDEILSFVKTDIESFKMGSPEDPSNFITAVIHQSSFDKLASYIEQAKKDEDATIYAGGNYDKSKGYFIQPTVIVTTNPKYQDHGNRTFRTNSYRLCI